MTAVLGRPLAAGAHGHRAHPDRALGSSGAPSTTPSAPASSSGWADDGRDSAPIASPHPPRPASAGTTAGPPASAPLAGGRRRPARVIAAHRDAWRGRHRAGDRRRHRVGPPPPRRRPARRPARRRRLGGGRCRHRVRRARGDPRRPAAPVGVPPLRRRRHDDQRNRSSPPTWTWP